ncbi:precorrin-2 dehydrogenase/sirohydrochlorin ferrochelatase family protein [Leptospira mayottensis]|uniref:precorrin-2 dehydrogenase n=2 Tax=Leptospira mayottensis TaxID=1137606 RepID=A0AA87SX48_9LEPT|nr:bifunctional precorrin-2 dehydrogenase/sirohydrochlorin ferrochelatase [Leptospira mayottensis]AXR60155.1 bifunctional precorrin-2 dehydrogenase/sirohydrochlorin ferrochelatase [Leptospira mayottensis]AXR63596.1 bifunctional precorrin-2 dehydrogenase/sirohydrochlorin ferrochelatase [Leptospira mayottensis]AZQ03424.1 bifunctional precorrin-2 dehydrogenase/sirohydrochlorin ferrochelatase [Leptospira mayottensis 200901116]EKR99810.1 siroheme synthase domain protein [Leptospira mayottensis 20090
MSRKYPAFLNLENKNILLIGGGKVALEKLPHLIDSGAKITLITLEACREVAQVLEKHPEIKVEYRSVEFSDLQGKTLVFSATNDSDLNRRLCDYAHSWKIWINCADDPSNCDFYSAAVLDRGLVRVAISTEGNFAGISGAVKVVLEELIPDEHEEEFKELIQLRKELKSILPSPESRKKILKELLQNLKEGYFKVSTDSKRI